MNCLRFSGSACPRRARRHRRAADDEQVHAGVDDGLPQLRGSLGRERRRDGDARRADLADACGDELRADRLGVELLHPPGRGRVVERGDLVEQRRGVVVARPEALEVEHAETAEPADRDRGLRRHDRVHRGRQHRQLQAVGVDLPGDRHLLRVAGAPARHDRDVVERVGPAAALAAADLHLVVHGRLE
jgi:hypothetical protein